MIKLHGLRRLAKIRGCSLKIKLRPGLYFCVELYDGHFDMRVIMRHLANGLHFFNLRGRGFLGGSFLDDDFAFFLWLRFFYNLLFLYSAMTLFDLSFFFFLVDQLYDLLY